MGKRVLPIDTSALDAARAVAHARAERANPAMTDDEVYAEARRLLLDNADHDSLNVAQDLLLENGCNLVDLGEGTYAGADPKEPHWSGIHGAVSAGIFVLIDIMDTRTALGETSMRWLVYDTWVSQAPKLAARNPDHLNPTRRYMVTIDITFRGRIRQRDDFNGFAMLEDAQRACAKICWEGVKALRHYLVTDNLSGGRGYLSGRGSVLWDGYIDPPAEIIDQKRPCDDFFDLLRDPDPTALNQAQTVAADAGYRLALLSAMSWNQHRRLQRIAPDQQIAIGAFVLEDDSEVVWYVTHRSRDRGRPFSTDLEITYQGETWLLALGSGVTIGESCRLGSAFAWERAKMVRVELAKGTTFKEWSNRGNYLQAPITPDGLESTPAAIRNPAGTKKPRAGRAPVRIVAKLASELTSPFPPGSVADTPETLVHYIDTYMHQATEVFMGVFLSIRNEIVGYSEFSSGLTSGVEVGAVGLFQAALLAGAAGIITVHNHPSGNIAPSAEDFALWGRLTEIGTILGMPVVDNLVIGRGKYYSEAMSGHRRPTRLP